MLFCWYFGDALHATTTINYDKTLSNVRNVPFGKGLETFYANLLHSQLPYQNFQFGLNKQTFKKLK